jgi:peptide-methionine (S)-S-oxide reductase
MRRDAAIWIGVLLVVLGMSTDGRAAGNGFPVPAVDDALSPMKDVRTVVLAGGCFWGMEEVFQHVRGVTDVVSGYAGGSARNAKYDLVSTGTTGHAESVKITYDASAVTLGRLLQVYFSVAHDPTQKDGQGPDIGPQYRSSIFFANEHQQQIANAFIKQLNASKVYRAPIATEVVPLEAFYAAEAYHQDYAARHPNERYIMLVDKPKVDALHKYWADIWMN